MGKFCRFLTILFNVLVVVIFTVIIYFHISYTRHTNTHKISTKCKTVYDCLGENQMCLDNECKCSPNYRWNSSAEECLSFLCVTDEDCRTSDEIPPKYMICKSEYYSAKKSCVCNYGYVTNRKTNFCKKILTDEEEEMIKLKNKVLLKNPNKRWCAATSDCHPNQFCHNNWCECQPNYVLDKKTNGCLFNVCNTDEDCNAFDTKRVCRHNSCENCAKYHFIDPKTRFCATTIDMFCQNTTDCTEYGDDNQICVNNRCSCRSNYKLNTTLSQCVSYKCRHDSDCQKDDPFRVCYKNRCKCATNYSQDMATEVCEFDSYNLWFLWLLWWLLIIPFILIGVVCFKRCSKHSSDSHNSSFNNRTPIVYYNKINYKTLTNL